MKNIGHNNPPLALDPKETIKKNIKRRKLIVDDGISLFKGVPLPTWIEMSLIDVCNRSCSFCPKSDENVAPDTYQKMSKKLIDKLYEDLKKPIFESFASEFLMVLKEINSFTKNIKEWAAPKKVSGSLLNFPSQDFLLYEPYGTILMISPWNYPFQLAMVPLIGAVATGNTVVLKPSESAPNTSKVLIEILGLVFPQEWVSVVEGDAKIAQALLKVQWDYIFYTGSTQVGKIVAKAAAEYLTPTTLELGGKSPCILDGTTPIEKTARRIVWGKFLNCGQT